jgi:hypothetical protein
MVKRLAIAAVVGALSVTTLSAQTEVQTSVKRKTLAFLAGAVFPLSHEGLTDFWMRGPGGTLVLMFDLNPAVGVGIGADAGLLSFRKKEFGDRYPGIPWQATDLGFFHLYLEWKYTIAPYKRLSPFVGATIGPARVSGASYGTMIDSVRVTYYDLPGRTRLALGGLCGLDFALVRGVALEAEMRCVYLLNDPNAGMLLILHAGGRVTL